VGPIDIGLLRAERERRVGHDMRAHLRSELYGYLKQTWLSPAGPGAQPITNETIRARIDDARKRLGTK
jgi:hypothetical protein